RQRLRHVDDDAHTGLEQLLGGDPVEIRVVDDRDVVLAEAVDEALRPAVEPGRTRELDQASHGLPRPQRPGTRARRASARTRPSARAARAPGPGWAWGRGGLPGRGGAGGRGSRSAGGG